MVKAVSWSALHGREVYICGVGAPTPLGFDASASAAAVRGAISAIGAHPFFVDKAGEPMSLARDAGLDTDAGVARGMEVMLLSAIAESLGDTFDAPEIHHIHCWLGLPDLKPGINSDLTQLLSSAVSNTFGFVPAAIHALSFGHSAGLMAMQVAAQKISDGELDVCLAAGVDSYHDPDTLEWLDQNGLLMSSENRNGFPPGEAAGACLLASRSVIDHYRLRILANIMAATTALEHHTIRGTEVCIGEGLTAALQGVIDTLSLPRQAVTATYCDLNGERYRNEEFVYALLRLQEAFVDAHDYQCPADCWGDVGAASGPLFASLAIAAGQRGYAKGVYPMMWAGSESGQRTAILLKLAQHSLESMGYG